MAAKTVATKKNAEKKSESQDTRGIRKTRVGLVVSDKMTKTVVVEVGRQMRHSTYKKFIRRTTRFYAHDEKEACNVGDRVEIVETRPLSKLKRWRVTQILSKASE